MVQVGGTTDPDDSVSVPIQPEARPCSFADLPQVDGTERCRGSSHLPEANQLGWACHAAVNALVRASGTALVPQIGGTVDVMPQIGGTCLTCDGNGQTDTRFLSHRPPSALSANSHNQRLSAVTERREDVPVVRCSGHGSLASTVSDGRRREDMPMCREQPLPSPATSWMMFRCRGRAAESIQRVKNDRVAIAGIPQHPANPGRSRVEPDFLSG
jgi:hypothetical protein